MNAKQNIQVWLKKSGMWKIKKGALRYASAHKYKMSFKLRTNFLMKNRTQGCWYFQRRIFSNSAMDSFNNHYLGRDTVCKTSEVVSEYPSLVM